MAITITKTLQSVEYADLYFVTSILYSSATLVAVALDGYETVGHYTDGFLPIIRKYATVTGGTAASAHANWPSAIPTAIGIIENVLNDSGFFENGVVS
jgi:hypothetical protein